MDPATRAALRADPRLSRFDPLGRIIYSDDFDEGYNGWPGLIGNYRGSLDTIRSALTCVPCGLPRSDLARWDPLGRREDSLPHAPQEGGDDLRPGPPMCS